MRRLLAALVLVLLWTTNAYADSPIPPHNWERVVGSYRFVMLSPYDQSAQGAEGRRYPAAGLYRIDGPPEPLWTVDFYAHEGEVFLSPDGAHLVRMGPWPSGGNFDELAVGFYRNGTGTKSYRVRDLVKNPENLPQSVSHYQWHGEVTYDPGQQRLTVATIPGITYVFDATTGEVLSPGGRTGNTPEERPANWGAVGIWTAGGLVVVLGALLLIRRSRSR